MRWLERFRARDDGTDARMERALGAAQAGDHAAALALWEPLAREGHARAANNIGACFAEGLGVEIDFKLAETWLTLAAEAGDPVGQRNLAALVMRDPEPDYARAAALYRQAATTGDAPAQDMLSWMLLEGEIMQADPTEAGFWAAKAADAGIASAMTRLGMLHHNALGIPRNAAEAALWWRRGAEGGDADGQAMFGAALHLGNGVAKDDIEALAWLLRAKAGGSALAAPFIPAVRAALSADAVAEAERRAAEPLESA